MKPFSALRLAFRFAAAIFLLFQIGSTSVQAQHPPRYAKTAGFVITGQTSFDRGQYWRHDINYCQCFNPPDSIYNPNYRYFLELHLDTLGVNCERRGFADFPDSAGTKFGNQYAPRDTVLAHVNTLRSTYLTGDCFLGGITLPRNGITRFELERHDTALFRSGNIVPTRSPYVRYPAFLKTSGLTGSNVSVAGATFPLWLRGTSVASDTVLNAVRMVRGTDAVGYFDSAYYPNTFLSPQGDSVHPWSAGIIDRKIIFRFRMKIENFSTQDTLSLVKSRNDSIFRVTIMQDSAGTVLDTVIRAQAFVHSGAWDTIDVPCMTRKSSVYATRVHLKWLGKITLTADYMDALTGRVFPGDNPDSLQLNDTWYPRQCQLDEQTYQTLTANRDSLLAQLVGHQFAKTYDGEMNFWWLQEEPQIGQVDLFKRIVKIFRDSSHIEAMAIMHDSAEQNDPNDIYHHGSFYGWGLPNVPQFMLEGVRLGWLDSSLYADPRFFVIEPYPFDYYMSQPRRIPTRDSATLFQWTSQHDVTLPSGAFTLYTPEDYRYRSFVKYFGYVNSHRQAQRITLRNSEPNFKHRFFTSLQDGATSLLGIRPNGDSLILRNHRGPTGAEMKATGHLAVSCGSSGFVLYTIFSGKVNPANGMYDGGVFKYNGDHSLSLDTITLRNADGTYSLRWTWMGWKERYDTVKSLLPLLRLYGDTLLLNCKYQGDYWAYELHKLTSPGTLAFDPSTLSAHPDTNITPDVYSSDSIANRTHVHISQWVDSVSGNDTLLYITNTRSDDSWNPDSTAGTFDTRYISLQLRANHLVSDVADTARLYRLDGSKVRTPYVHAGEKLIVRLLPGDGVLVRLANVDTTAKHQMQIALDFPKPPPLSNVPQDFYDHGRIKFDKYVEGTQQADSSAPSSRYSFVGIKDNSNTTMWQDSMLYQKFDATRPELWRQHNWDLGNGSSLIRFKNIVPPATSRPRQTGMDSIAHSITITTDLEDNGAHGSVTVLDPFYVGRDQRNSAEFTSKLAPFNPQTNAIAGGLDSNKYGGIFLSENPSKDPVKPSYIIKAFSVIKNNQTYRSFDSVPLYSDYFFTGWSSNDTAHHNDPKPLIGFTPQQTDTVTFMKDGATYTAHYKAHMVATAISGLADSGFSWNNQRKLAFIGRDSLNRPWYRIVYTSKGRIYTTVGWRNEATGFLSWSPEHQIDQPYDNSTGLNGYPALAMHVNHLSAHDTTFSYIYQLCDTDPKLYYIPAADPLNPRDITPPYYHGSVDLDSASTPSIAAVEIQGSKCDIIAYHARDGIHLRGYRWDPGVYTPYTFEKIVGDSNSQFPSVWVEYDALADTLSNPFVYLAWQDSTNLVRKTALGNQRTSDIMGRRYQLHYNFKVPAIWQMDSVLGTVSENISYENFADSYGNAHPCLSGVRINKDTTFLTCAYESNRSGMKDSINKTSVVVALRRGVWQAGSGAFTGDVQFDPNTFNNDGPYTQPSITATRYHKTGGALNETYYNYSLAFECLKHNWVLHYAMDSNHTRITPAYIEGCKTPQLCTIYSTIDSSIERISLAAYTPAQNWAWLVYAAGRLTQKMAGIDTIWRYRAISEWDSAHTFRVQHGMGELEVDDNVNQNSVELMPRMDMEEVGTGNNPPRYFMRSEQFTMPMNGTFSYARWLRTTDDSLFKLKKQTVKYVLDFVDTNGVLVVSLDTVEISDTAPEVKAVVHSTSIALQAATDGYVVLHRTTLGFFNGDAVRNDFIRRNKISVTGNYKRAGGHLQADAEGLLLTSEPNPFHGLNEVTFAIPRTGAVSIRMYDLLGREVETLMTEREYRTGTHTMQWDGTHLVPGSYTIVMRYGNSVRSVNVMLIR